MSFSEPEEVIDEDSNDQDTGILGFEGNNFEVDQGSNATKEETEITFKDATSNFVETQPRDGSVYFDSLRGDPAFANYIKRMMAKELKDERDREKKQRVVAPRTPKNSALPPVIQKSPARHTFPGTVNHNKNKGNNMVKSPSDTTLYAPALNKTEGGHKQIAVKRILNDQISGDNNNGVTHDFDKLNLDEQVNQFIEGIKQQLQDKRVIQDRNPQVDDTPRSRVVRVSEQVVPDEAVAGTSRDDDDAYQENVDAAKMKASDMIFEAERFKAAVNTPPGNNNHNFNLINEEI